jgi:hypothetical protein
VNVFVLSWHPEKAAEYHADKHVVKMIVETAQLLSTAHHVLDDALCIGGIYKKTHENHPCAVWARENIANYQWLHKLGVALLDEYTKRYSKHHKTSSVMETLQVSPWRIPDGVQTPFAQAMPDVYKHEDPVVAYRRYYQGEKASIATWRHSKRPWWFKGANQ